MAPRMYLALDAMFLESAAIEELGEKHGPAGPLVVVALLCAAKCQGRGEVKTTLKRLASDAFLGDAEEARAVVASACGLKILDPLPDHGGERTVHVCFPRWKEWQQSQKDKDRQAEHRAKQRLADLEDEIAKAEETVGSKNGLTPHGRADLAEVGP